MRASGIVGIGISMLAVALCSCGRQQEPRRIEGPAPDATVIRAEGTGSLDAAAGDAESRNESDEQTRLARLLLDSKSGGKSWLELIREFRGDPMSATDRILAGTRGSRAYLVLQAVSAEIAADDPGFVRQWVGSLTGETRAQVAMGLISVWVRSAPNEAARWMSENALIYADPRCQEVLVSRWAELDVHAAARWSYGLPTGMARRSALQALGRVWGRDDSVSAVGAVAEIDQPEERDDFSVSVAEGWALRDANTAVSWFLKAALSDESRRAQSLYALFSDLAGQDVPKAEQELSAMPSGPNRDAAIRGFIDTLEIENPQKAVPWVWKITDDEERSEVVNELSESLAGRHPTLVEQLRSVPGVGN